ncbi:MAG TPA: GIY-YIG nuclease family protein [Ignavibacteriaceae bacterium]
MWFVYILKCNNGDYYKGCTNDLNKRLAKHQHGKVESTCENLPVEMVSYIAFTDKNKAFKFEKYLKSGSGRAFLKKRLV